MIETEFKERLEKIVGKYVSQSLPEKEAEEIVKIMLEQPWIKKLLVYADTAFIIADLVTLKYHYVSPAIYNLYGVNVGEITGAQSLARVLDPDEAIIFANVAGLALKKLAALKLHPDEMRKIRWTRNNWHRRMDGQLINVLKHSMGLTYNEQGMVVLEFIVCTDITDFNSSPHHFYKLTLEQDDGYETVLLEGVWEQESKTEIITNRERQILTAMAQGQTSTEIAQHLNISMQTVKTHRKNLLGKTKSENSIDLLRYGYAQGWL